MKKKDLVINYIYECTNQPRSNGWSQQPSKKWKIGKYYALIRMDQNKGTYDPSPTIFAEVNADNTISTEEIKCYDHAHLTPIGDKCNPRELRKKSVVRDIGVADKRIKKLTFDIKEMQEKLQRTEQHKKRLAATLDSLNKYNSDDEEKEALFKKIAEIKDPFQIQELIEKRFAFAE